VSAAPILVLNAGSSSLKFTVYRHVTHDECDVAASGQIEGIGTSPRLIARDGAGVALLEEAIAEPVANCSGALVIVAKWLRSYLGGVTLGGVGHRVVHGGSAYPGPTRVSPEVLSDLRKLIPLAPLHQPYNLEAIEAVGQRLPDVPQVACFDTSFHRGQSAVAELVPLPLEVRRHGVQRYGFHGLSYEYIASVLPQVAPDIANGRIIVAHLGSGASLCALKNGRSVDSTLGFTALDGLCMGTRPGAVDPGVILYLFQSLKLSASEVEAMLYRQSGLLGISGVSNDMRKLLGSSEPSARLAIDYFVYRAVKEIGALAAVLGGIDGLVFTAGIGEKSADIRRLIARGCQWLGLELDEEANHNGQLRISTQHSRLSAWVIPTNEELMIARHTATLLGLMKTSAADPA
jgi:acetate kinase